MWIVGQQERKISIITITVILNVVTEELKFQETAFRTYNLNPVLAKTILINNKLQNKKRKKHF